MDQHGLSRRDLLKAAAVASVPAWLAACFKGGPKAKELHFYTWSNYTGKRTIPDFEKQTGTKVVLDLFSDEEEMQSKLKTGVQGYDLTVATDYMIPRLKALNIISPFPQGALQNLGNLEPRFAHPPYDPELAYTVPYLWGTTGIAYSKKHFPDGPPASWKTLWDKKYEGKVSALDNARDAIGCALLMLGLPTDAGDPASLDKAADLLLQQKPLLKHYTNSTYIEELVSGEIWLAQAWSGDAMQASRDNPDIDFVIPKEGSFIWVDSLCLIRGSRHVPEALSFTDYLLKPEVAAEISETVRYPTPNEKARPLLSKDLLKDARVYPSAATFKRLQFYSILDEEKTDLWNQTWQKVKVA